VAAKLKEANFEVGWAGLWWICRHLQQLQQQQQQTASWKFEQVSNICSVQHIEYAGRPSVDLWAPGNSSSSSQAAESLIKD
jgi:hypothetical protein